MSSSEPRQVGPYRILEKVSARAFTVTYRAEQRGVGRTVLLRTLKPTLAPGSTFATELAREALILGRLEHEGIVRVYDFVRTETASYLVLEDPRAVPLDELLAKARDGRGRGALEPDVAAAVVLAAARAVAHAHGRGVVHRALCTAALSVAAPGRVLVGDFSAADAKIADLPPIPEAGADPGERTSFLAPEQILGDAADARSDVWALGVVLHVVLAGAHPFAGDDPREIARRIRTSPPADPPAEVPPAIARTIARCLAKDPEDRFGDARALASALEDALGKTSSAGVPVPVLVSRALAAAGLGEALTVVAAAPVEPGGGASPIDVGRAARSLSVVLAFIVAGGGAIRLLDDRDAGEGEGVPERAAPGVALKDAGLVRVVARPWAEVYVDGELVDVTPIGRPLRVSPGRHFVTFRHPNAPDEQRTIKIGAGQSVFLDVTMRVDRGDAGASRDAAAAPASP